MTAGSRDRGGGDADRPGPADDADDPAPSDAFQALGNETRMTVVRTLADDQPRAFSALFEASNEDTSAGFAYHLRQLSGRFVRQREDDRYELTSAGRSVAKSVRAGTYTDSVDSDAVELGDDCPFCGDPALVATVADNVTEVACEACGSPLLGLSFPPSGYEARDDSDVPAAIDAYHRRRIETFADGVCPDCGGAVTATIVPADATDEDGSADESRDDGPSDRGPVQLSFACEDCGSDLRCPVALTVLDHPAVVAFYHDHGRDVTDRPLWNVGTEWRERVLSRDPWCVQVRTRLDGEDLFLYLAGDGSVVERRRVGPDDERPFGDDESANADAPADAEGGVERADVDEDPAESVDAGDGATA